MGLLLYLMLWFKHVASTTLQTSSRCLRHHWIYVLHIYTTTYSTIPGVLARLQLQMYNFTPRHKSGKY